MNRFEKWFCASSFWRGVTRRQLLPWILHGTELGEHVLEIGAGAGPATEELRKHAERVTSLDYSHQFAVEIARRSLGADGSAGANASVVQGDAAALPFPAKTFSAATAVLVLHHLKSREAQAAAIAEAFRVLRPGGIFLAIEIEDGWLQRLTHFRSSFLPVAPQSLSARLAAVGFVRVTADSRRGAFRVRAERPRETQ
jgi:ubiquinone/menaquinone biosynthesis C-methylase UbiE